MSVPLRTVAIRSLVCVREAGPSGPVNDHQTVASGFALLGKPDHAHCASPLAELSPTRFLEIQTDVATGNLVRSIARTYSTDVPPNAIIGGQKFDYPRDVWGRFAVQHAAQRLPAADYQISIWLRVRF